MQKKRVRPASRDDCGEGRRAKLANVSPDEQRIPRRVDSLVGYPQPTVEAEPTRLAGTETPTVGFPTIFEHSQDGEEFMAWPTPSPTYDHVDDEAASAAATAISPWMPGFHRQSAATYPVDHVPISSTLSILGPAATNFMAITLSPSPGDSPSPPTFEFAATSPGGINEPMGTLSLDWELVEFTPPSVTMPSCGTSSPYGTATDTHAVQEQAILQHPSEVPVMATHRFVTVDPTNPTRQRRRPFQDKQLRYETSQTRALKACVRCRMQKLRCNIETNDPSGVCVTCKGVTNQKVHYLPCLRHRFSECVLYRTGKPSGLEYTFRWPRMALKDIVQWARPELHIIFVKSQLCQAPLKLVVRKFDPIPQDSVHRSWMDHEKGVKKYYETAPYAISDMRAALNELKSYIEANVFDSMSYFLQGSDPLIKMTYQFAIGHLTRLQPSPEKTLLSNFFRLWFAALRVDTMEYIAGEDTLGMAPETDATFPLPGRVPLPPVMIQQLDMILVLGILGPLQKSVLEDLQKLVLANNPKHWMTVYLVTFMSLHSCSQVSLESYNNARKNGLLRRFSNPNFIAERHHAANVFLSHYHYRTESRNPFKQQWTRRHQARFRHMSQADIQFLERTKELVAANKNLGEALSTQQLYEHELYFVRQMFEDGWKPRDSKIDYSDGTVNGLPLKYVGGKAFRFDIGHK